MHWRLATSQHQNPVAVFLRDEGEPRRMLVRRALLQRNSDRCDLSSYQKFLHETPIIASLLRTCGRLRLLSEGQFLERVPMRSNHLCAVMPAQRHPAASRRGDPIFAGIHFFLPCFSKQDVDCRGNALLAPQEKIRHIQTLLISPPRYFLSSPTFV